jgi:tripeptidyl-peptidase-1
MSGTTIDIGNGIMVDPSCNTTITVDCLKQLYNATNFEGQGKGSIGITGYLEQNV